MTVREHTATGLEYLDLVTRLLQRARRPDPTAGLWDTADLQWWWRKERRSDRLEQVFWQDADGPIAAAILTDWGGTWSCEPIVSPQAPEAMLTEVWSRVIERVDALGLDSVEVTVRDDDRALAALLEASGFAATAEQYVGASMRPEARPRPSPPPHGYRLRDRTQTATRAHHMIARNGAAVAERLAQCSLYRPELDLLIETADGEVAAYGLFWCDPVTGVGLVEPMRTEDEHQRCGLGRALLAAGLDRLAALGCEVLHINYELANPASGPLYLETGFRPMSSCRVYARRSI